MSDRKVLRLVEGAIKGDKGSFDRLMQARSRNILYIAMSIMRDKESGEDVAQEAAAVIQGSISKLKNPEAFDSWMYRIVYNTCMDEKKKMARTQAYAEIDLRVENMVPESRDEFLPHDFLSSKEKRAELLAAIHELPEKYQMCVLLFYYEDMGYAEIADVLDIDTQNVAYYLHVAKKKLRQQLDAGYFAPEAGAEATTEAADTTTDTTKLPHKNAGLVAAAPIISQVLHLDESIVVTAGMVNRFALATGIGTASVGVGTGTAAATSALSVGAGGLFLSMAESLKNASLAKIAVSLLATAAIAGGVYTVTVVNEETVETHIMPLTENAAPEAQLEQGQEKPTAETAAENEAEEAASEGEANESSEANGANEIAPESPASETPDGAQNANPADKLPGYAEEGTTEEEWDEYVEQAQLYYKGSTYGRTPEGDFEYSVYLLDDPHAEAPVVTIERNDSNGNVEVVYRTIESEAEIPEKEDIIRAFDEWS